MAYVRSHVTLLPNKLFKAVIVYSYYYFFEYEVFEIHPTFDTAKKWIVDQRVKNFDIIDLTVNEPEKIEQEIKIGICEPDINCVSSKIEEVPKVPEKVECIRPPLPTFISKNEFQDLSVSVMNVNDFINGTSKPIKKQNKHKF